MRMVGKRMGVEREREGWLCRWVSWLWMGRMMWWFCWVLGPLFGD